MILLLSCCLLFGAVPIFGQSPFRGSARLRTSETEKFFYNGLDRRIEVGWSDDRSVGVETAYGVVLPPAQNLAQINFSQANSVWRIEARDQGYRVKEEDEVIFRIRGESERTSLVFFAGPNEDNEIVRHPFTVVPQWHLVHVPMKAFPSPLRVAGIRSETPGRATVHVAYMYLRVNPGRTIGPNNPLIVAKKS